MNEHASACQKASDARLQGPRLGKQQIQAGNQQQDAGRGGEQVQLKAQGSGRKNEEPHGQRTAVFPSTCDAADAPNTQCRERAKEKVERPGNAGIGCVGKGLLPGEQPGIAGGLVVALGKGIFFGQQLQGLLPIGQRIHPGVCGVPTALDASPCPDA